MLGFQSSSDDSPYNDIALIGHYVKRLLGQFLVLLGLVFTAADTISAVAQNALSFLPDWLDSGLEFASWVLWLGIVVGGYRIFRDERKANTAKLADLRGRLAKYESAKPDVIVRLLGHESISNSQDVSIEQVAPLRPLESYEKYWRSQMEVAYQQEERWHAEYFSGSDMRLRTREEYNADVDTYVKDSGLHLRTTHHYETARACVRPVVISVSNIGTAAARDVTVEIELPSNVRIATADEVAWYLDDEGLIVFKRPEAPSATVHLWLPQAAYVAQYPIPFDESLMRSEDERGPIARQNGRVIEYRFTSAITSGQSVDDLDPFYLMLDQIDHDMELPLNVKILGDGLHLPQMTTMYLSVKLTEVVSAKAA